MNIANKFKIESFAYGYTVLEHIEYDKEVDGEIKHIDRWDNQKYFGSIESAKEYIVKRYEQELVGNDEYIQFVNAVDKMSQLKREVVELSVRGSEE